MVQVYNSTSGPQMTAKFSSFTAGVHSLFIDDTSKFMTQTDPYRTDFNDSDNAPLWIGRYLWDSQFDDSILSYHKGDMSKFCHQMGHRINALNQNYLPIVILAEERLPESWWERSSSGVSSWQAFTRADL